MGAGPVGFVTLRRTSTRGGPKPDTRVSADAALSLVLPCYADPAHCKADLIP